MSKHLGAAKILANYRDEGAMAFYCDINDDFIEVDQFHSDGRSHAMFSRIGHQPSRTTTYFAYVGFDIMPGGTDHEFYFFVLALNDATGEEHRYFSGVDTRRLISSPEDRSRVLRAICEMTFRLLHMVRPNRVFWYTYDDYPPGKALDKYDQIVSVFQACAYVVTRNDSYERKREWWADKYEDRS
ncbi:hypothetical protein [Magnetospirillum moscoviense]|uniref:hypothetical protein n=1 Tax=Magnetospirillum moscoviense TaxID=1437059 RepID=UPI0012E93B01|nr:hypothetical protein [Magnetospirillum moscoviense]